MGLILNDLGIKFVYWQKLLIDFKIYAIRFSITHFTLEHSLTNCKLLNVTFDIYNFFLTIALGNQSQSISKYSTLLLVTMSKYSSSLVFPEL